MRVRGGKCRVRSAECGAGGREIVVLSGRIKCGAGGYRVAVCSRERKV